MTPTHDAYLENVTCIGLTVGKFIVAYAEWFANMRKNLNNKKKIRADIGLLDLAADRYSVCAYSNRPIEPEKMERTLKAGQLVPTVVNFDHRKSMC